MSDSGFTIKCNECQSEEVDISILHPDETTINDGLGEIFIDCLSCENKNIEE